jgi:hypothetical protein
MIATSSLEAMTMRAAFLAGFPALALTALACNAHGPAPPPQGISGAATRVRQAVQDVPEGAGGEITVAIHAGVIVISGKVKSGAEASNVVTIAEVAAAGAHVTSRIEVDADPEEPAARPSADSGRALVPGATRPASSDPRR